MTRRLTFTTDRCLACHSCELACAVAHSASRALAGAIAESPAPARRVIVRGGGAQIEVLRCDQCDEPLCAFSCKSGALRRDPRTGVIALADDQCVGCWMCVMVCPHGVRPDPAGEVAVRCDLCPGRETPACVEACKTGALGVEDVRADAGDRTAPVRSDFRGRVIVVGSSAAGIAACEAVRERAPGAAITLVTADDNPSYSRPLLPYLLADKMASEQIAWRDRGHLRECLEVELLASRRAAGVDCGGKKLRLADGAELSFDQLIIATGARASMPDLPGIAREGVFGLRDLEDLEAIARLAKPGRRALVLGGGNVGLQACEGLLALGVATTLVVRSPHLLSQMVDAEVGRRVGELFGEHGLTLRTGRDVTEILGAERAVGARLDNGEELAVDLVVVGKGIRPNVEWLAETGTEAIEVDWGVLVDRCGRTNVEGVFAAGDCAQMPDPLTGQTAVSGIWPVAYESGFSAGSTAVGIERPAPGALRMNASRFFGVPMISIGEVRDEKLERAGAEARILIDRPQVYRKLVYRDGVLYGALLYGDISGAGTFYRLHRQQTKLDEAMLRNVDDHEVERALAPLVSEGA